MEGPMNEITEWTMLGPIVLPKKGRRIISNEPSNALVAYVLSFCKVAPDQVFAFCNASS